MLFSDRTQAGLLLARKVLEECRFTANSENKPVVLAIATGGVPIGFEIALTLKSAFDFILARKITAPGLSQLAIGAVSTEDVFVADHQSIEYLGLCPEEVIVKAQAVRDGARALEARWRKESTLVKCDLHGRTCLVVDDGSATGLTAIAALRTAKQLGAARLIFAAPVMSERAHTALSSEAHQIISVVTHHKMANISESYIRFAPVPEDDVIAVLRMAADMNSPDEDRLPVDGYGTRATA